MIKNFNINKNSTQSGRSMIEMLGVLAIVGVLSVGGIAGYSKAMQKFKINKTAEQISQVVTNIRTLYAQQTTYDGLNTATAIQMGITPDELGTVASQTSMGSGQSALTNAFGGWFEIETEKKSSTSSNDAFSITIGEIPKDVCISLATMDWGTSYSTGLIAIGIGSWGNFFDNALTDNCTNAYNHENGNGFIHCSKNGPIPVALAAEACRYDAGLAFSLKFY